MLIWDIFQTLGSLLRVFFGWWLESPTLSMDIKHLCSWQFGLVIRAFLSCIVWCFDGSYPKCRTGTGLASQHMKFQKVSNTTSLSSTLGCLVCKSVCFKCAFISFFSKMTLQLTSTNLFKHRKSGKSQGSSSCERSPKLFSIPWPNFQSACHNFDTDHYINSPPTIQNRSIPYFGHQ